MYPYIAFGSTVLMDLRSDTVAPSVLLSGYKAHDNQGNAVVGTLSTSGRYTPDEIAMGTLSGVVSGSATAIHSYAFYNTNITGASFSQATAISPYAFDGCPSLSIASFPLATTISSYAFRSCSQLASVYFPVASRIESYAFAYCSSLASVTFPEVTDILASAFHSAGITSASFPKAQYVSARAFMNCVLISTLYLGDVQSIWGSAFYSIGLYGHPSIYIAGSTVCSVNSLTFSGVVFGRQELFSTVSATRVYVPSSLYSQYIVASYWSAIASYIVSY